MKTSRAQSRMYGSRYRAGIGAVLIGLLLLGALVAASLYGASSDAAQVLKTHKLADNAYALVGPLTNRDAENLGNNANFGFLVTTDGVVLIDPGGSYKGAQMIDAAIRKITDKPVTVVINTGGQDHRWLGNGYFKAQGARIIASEKAVADQKTRSRDQLIALASLIGPEGLEGTEPVYADETFSEATTLTVGGTRLEIRHPGAAHTPGDSFVWLPDQKILFSGDIVYIDRMLSIGPQSEHKNWISAFEALAALKPEVVVAGHGDPADLAKATADSYAYLVFLRQAVLDLMDQGGGIEDVGTLDQSRFSYLENYDTLKGRNAQRVYEELEWE
jgi:glyoxylase-like metal-dependent hydrolase (beta-lactamase superfamily II)